MFAGYNKGNKKGTLTGNWVEEESLRTVTGFSRYPDHNTLIKKDNMETSTSNVSFQRVIEHNDAMNPKEYRASSNLSSPSLHEEHQLPSSIGSRKAQKQQLLYKKAKEMEEALLISSSHNDTDDYNPYASEHSSTYTAVDTEYLITQPRVPPRGRNGGRPVDGTIAGCTKGQVEARTSKTLASYSNNNQEYVNDTAVSIYSHSLKAGMGLNYAVSAASSLNPFAKSTAFTNDIRDGRKETAEASHPGTTFATPLGSTVHQRSALEKVRTCLVNVPDVKKTLKENCNGMENYLSFTEFENGIRSISACDDITLHELHHLFMLCDVDHTGSVEFAALLSLLDI